MTETVMILEILTLNYFYCINLQILVMIYQLLSELIVYDYLSQFVKRITCFNYFLLALMNSFDAEILNIIKFQLFICSMFLCLILHFNYFKVHINMGFPNVFLFYFIDFINYFLIKYHSLYFIQLNFCYFCI